MAAIKTATLNLRIDPGVKEAVKEAAQREHRSVANFLELLVRQHCQEVGITVPEQQEMSFVAEPQVKYQIKTRKKPKRKKP